MLHYNRRRQLRFEYFGRLISISALFAILLLLSPVQMPAQSTQKSNNANSTAQNPQDIPLLEPGKPIERELKGGEVHSYKIALSAGQYLKTIVEQRGIDVVVRLFAPDGKQIIEVDSPNGTQGAEPISVVTEAAGNYRLEVRSLEANAVAGRYEAKIDELRAATTKDRKRIVAEQLYAEGKQLSAEGTAESLQKAIKKYEESLPLWRESEDRLYVGVTLNQIGFNYGAMGDKKKAIDYFQESLLIFQAIGNRSEEATSLNNIGLAYADLGENQKALEIFNRALPIMQTMGNRLGEAQTLRNIGLAYDGLGETQKALDYYNQALPIMHSAEDRLGEAVTILNIGAVYANRGENQKSLEYFLQALPILKSAGDRAAESTALINIGAIYRILGENQKALDYLNQALPLLRLAGDRLGEARMLFNIGIVYNNLGDYERSLEHYKQSLPIMQQLGNRNGEAILLGSIGFVYRDKGEHRKALDYYNQALPIAKSINDRISEARTLTNIGRAFVDLGDSRKALEYLNQALPIMRAAGDRRGESQTLNLFGYANMQLGEKQQALVYYQQSLELRRAVGDPSGESATLANIARLERDRSNLVEAKTRIEAAINIVETLRTKIASQELRASYLASIQNYYELYVDILMRLHKQRPAENFSAAALQATERGRARSLLELLAEARADIRQGVDPQLLERERNVQQQINAKAKRQTELLGGKHTIEQAAVIKKELDDLNTEYQQIEARIRQTSPRYAALTQPQPLSLKEIQTQVLDSDTLLLEYSLGEDKSYLWAVTPDSITSYELPKRAEIETAARRFYELLTARNNRSGAVKGETEAQRTVRLAKDSQRIAEADAQLPEAANKLSQMILAPAAAQLGTKRLVVVADGALQYIPFAALPEPVSAKEASGTGQFLIVNHEIISLPSASTLAVLRRETAGRSPAARMVAVVADPVFSKDDSRVDDAISRNKKGIGTKNGNASTTALPENFSSLTSVVRSLEETGVTRGEGNIPRLDGTRREANGILALTSGDAGMKRIDFEANRAAVTGGELSQFRIVHFATHGLLNSEHPELSGLVLSLVDERGKAQDGFLRLHEIYNLKLPAELVVLSACQTALGKEIKGEGLVGLTRGFMYAGSPRVVASLWQVDDTATRDLMAGFYRAMLTDKLRPAAALRRAQIEMLRQKQSGKPYNWAAFVLQGEWK